MKPKSADLKLYIYSDPQRKLGDLPYIWIAMGEKIPKATFVSPYLLLSRFIFKNET